jgi:integrase
MVYKQAKSKYWWYKFTWNGRLIRVSTKQTNKRTAEQIQAARKTQLAKGEVGIEDQQPVPALKEFAPRFEQFIETECAEKPATIHFYKAKLKCLLAGPLANRRLDTIGEREIQDYIELRRATRTRRNAKLSPASVNRELATLRRMLRLAYKWRLLRRIPTISLLRGEKNRETVLTREQEALYLEIAPEPLRSVALVLLDTGLRMGELLTLDWADVRMEPPPRSMFGYLTVRSGKSKNSKSRNVPLTARVTQFLKSVGPKSSGLVFSRRDGRPLCQTYLNEQARKLRRLLKLPADLTPHAFRHTFGTRLGESGADAFTIMKLMGHSSITISQRYVHPTPEAVERAFTRFEVFQQGAQDGAGILSVIPVGSNALVQDQVF